MYVLTNKKQSGFTLVELMVALMLGLVLTGALMSMFGQARKSFRQDEIYASMQDEARYAMQELSGDVSMAGYIGDMLSPTAVALDASLAIDTDCESDGGESFAFRLNDSVTGFDTTLMALDNIVAADAVTTFGCLIAGELVPGTDIVAVKRLAGSSTDTAVAGDIKMRFNGTVASLFIEPIAAAVSLPYEDRFYEPVIYFIRNYTLTPGDDIPALCRKVLVSDGNVEMVTNCIAAGIEDLQVEFGVDNNGDGTADSYIAAPTQEQLQTAVSARINLLARTTEEDRSYTDTKTYSLSNADDREPDDSFRRRVFTTTVGIPNLRSRSMMGI